MNLRRFVGLDKPFATFNREERNLAAIFFFAINCDGNLARFLSAAGCNWPQDDWEPAVYFEFTYIRDLWKQISQDDQKRAFILACIKTPKNDWLADCPIEDFNRFFGAGPNPSKTQIQSPSRWGLRRFDNNIEDNETFLAVCMFKWAFNAKPDLVIQTGPDQCVCIEAKLKSGEGSYPGSKEDKAVFRRRGLSTVRQTSLQHFALIELLGFETEFVYLALKRPAEEGHRFVSWAAAFDAMQTEALPNYMKQTIAAMTSGALSTSAASHPTNAISACQ